MSDQDILDAHNEGFDDGYEGCAKANPYFPGIWTDDQNLWGAYEIGYQEGKKRRAANAEPTT